MRSQFTNKGNHFAKVHDSDFACEALWSACSLLPLYSASLLASKALFKNLGLRLSPISVHVSKLTPDSGSKLHAVHGASRVMQNLRCPL